MYFLSGLDLILSNDDQNLSNRFRLAWLRSMPFLILLGACCCVLGQPIQFAPEGGQTRPWRWTAPGGDQSAGTLKPSRGESVLKQ